MLRIFWKRGEKIALSARCSIPPSLLSEYLAARRVPSIEMAEKLEKEAAGMGVYLSANDLRYPHHSRNPLMNNTYARQQRGY